MKSHSRMFWIVVILFAVTAALTSCGPKGPETDLDVNGRVLEVKPDESWIRIGEQGAGRKYEMKTTASTEIVQGKDTLTLAEVKVGNQVRIWANEVEGTPKYEIVKLMVVDSGEAAPSMR